MITIPTMMIVTRPTSPPQQQQQQQQLQDPPAEVENRLVVISQKGRRHYHNTPALEPEEYAYPREFTSLTIMKPSAPAGPQPQSKHVGTCSSRRGSTGSSNYPQNQLTTIPLSSINDHRIGAIIATMTTTTSSSSAHEQYNGYQHCFVTVLTEHRFLMLYTFLSRHSHHNAKIVVLFSTTESLMYYTALLHRLKFNVRAVHAGMKRKEVDATLQEFSMSVGCSDEVEEDGDDDDSNTRILCMLDFQDHDTSMTIPSTTNWIVQFEPCTKPSEYIYQVGRISHESSIGGGRRPSNNCRQTPPRALLFLTPNEYGFHRHYKAAQVKTCEYEIPHLCNVQNRLIKLLRSDDNSQLRKLGLRACRSYLFAYARHEFGDIYNVKELDIEKVALSFGFDKLPSEELLEGIRNGGKDDDDDDDDDADALDIVVDEKVRSTSRSNKISSSGNSWRRKPVKANNNANWMTGEKTWRHADRHAEKMKVNSNKSSSSASIKPKFVVTR
jgi:ATP-dependent RNA helicase DDX18/HAS1